MDKRARAHRRAVLDVERKRRRREEYTLQSTFKLKHFYKSLPRCRENVSWKASVQNYMATCVYKIYKDYLTINHGKLPAPSSDKKQTICERGKPREITPIHIRDRENQKVLCDFALTPALMRYLIYDNGASLVNKGVQFSRDRMYNHVKRAIKEFGTDFYVLTFDFKSFFDSIPHKTCQSILDRYFADDTLVKIAMEVIKAPYRSEYKKVRNPAIRNKKLKVLDNNELFGICLGSQVSQIMALIVANELDHCIKDEYRCKGYIRYMDDGVLFAKTKEELKLIYARMVEVCNELGLKFNTKKTHISKIKCGFVFLKVKYFVLLSGKIVRKLTRDGIVRMRRKLKKFRKKVDDGVMSYDDVYTSLQSWLAHSKIAKSYHTVKSMLKLYDKLFGGYRMKKGGIANVLQIDRWEKYRWSCAAS